MTGVFIDLEAGTHSGRQPREDQAELREMHCSPRKAPTEGPHGRLQKQAGAGQAPLQSLQSEPCPHLPDQTTISEPRENKVWEEARTLEDQGAVETPTRL